MIRLLFPWQNQYDSRSWTWYGQSRPTKELVEDTIVRIGEVSIIDLPWVCISRYLQRCVKRGTALRNCAIYALPHATNLPPDAYDIYVGDDPSAGFCVDFGRMQEWYRRGQ